VSLWDWLYSLFHRPPKPRPPDPPPVGPTSDVLIAVNAARFHYGLAPLAGGADLDAVALGHAQVMATRGVLAHEGIGDGTPAERLTAAGIRWMAEGECAAPPGYPNAQAAVNAWLADPPHRRILLGDYARLGAGFADGYWCADLVRP
jgi:uncharacterized protein YkwD